MANAKLAMKHSLETGLRGRLFSCVIVLYKFYGDHDWNHRFVVLGGGFILEISIFYANPILDAHH